MDKIVLTGTPYDGEYDLDSGEPFSILEWRWIKRISGYMPGTANDGLAGQDPDLFLALAMIALVRNGKVAREHVFQVADAIAESGYRGGSTIVYREEEVEEADPPAEPQKPSPEDDESENGSSDTSGDDSTESSARSGNGQSPTGLPLSAIRAMSESVT